MKIFWAALLLAALVLAGLVGYGYLQLVHYSMNGRWV